MNARASVSRRIGTFLAAGLGLVLPLSGFAADNLPPETLAVKVFPDRYVAAGKPFANLAALEAWARPILLREVWVDSCGPASAARALAAVEHFQSAYKGAIRVRTLPSGEAGCVSAAAYVSLTYEGTCPEDRAYFASDEFGRSMLP